MELLYNAINLLVITVGRYGKSTLSYLDYINISLWSFEVSKHTNLIQSFRFHAVLT